MSAVNGRRASNYGGGGDCSVPAVLRLGNGGGGLAAAPRSISSISGTGNHREPLQVDNGDDRIAGVLPFVLSPDLGLIEDEPTAARPSIAQPLLTSSTSGTVPGTARSWGRPAPGFGLRRHLLLVTGRDSE
jgi:hypothetical protein